MSKIRSKRKNKNHNELPLRTHLEKCFDSLVTQHHCSSMASVTASWMESLFWSLIHGHPITEAFSPWELGLDSVYEENV